MLASQFITNALNNNRLSRPLLLVPKCSVIGTSRLSISVRCYSPSTRMKIGNPFGNAYHWVHNNFPVSISSIVQQQEEFSSEQKRALWCGRANTKGLGKRENDHENISHPQLMIPNASLNMATKELSFNKIPRQHTPFLVGHSVAPLSISSVTSDSVSAASDAALSWNTVFRAMVGNSLICVLKFTAWIHTGSGAMFAEAVHTLVSLQPYPCGNLHLSIDLWLHLSRLTVVTKLYY